VSVEPLVEDVGVAVLPFVFVLMIVHHASVEFTLGVRVIREVIHSSSGKRSSQKFARKVFRGG
jgi:hypothetical protein